MGLAVLRRLAPALLALIAILAVLSAQGHDDPWNTVFYVIAAIAIGGVVGLARPDR